VLRVRDTATLAENPVDPSGLYRLACVGLALVLGGLALTTPRSVAPEDRIALPTPLLLFGLYVIVVFIGAPLSVNADLTSFRGVELLAGFVVVLGAVRLTGREAPRRIGAVLYWFIVALIASAWVAVALFPTDALRESRSPLPVQLQGVYPTISSNTLGLLGVLLVVWTLGRMLSSESDRRLPPVLAGILILLGVATLVVAQYRTGYVALALGIALLLLVRGRKAFGALVAVLAVAIAIWGHSLGLQAEPFLLRGQSTQEAEQLSSRLGYWEAALPVWRRSPIVGRGLVTATRFEVLAPLGRSFTSTIHSTWVEALVGTGIIGVALLATALLLAFKQALQEAFRVGGEVVPVFLLTVLIIRSATGTTFEIFGLGTLLFLMIILDLAAPAPAVRPARVGGWLATPAASPRPGGNGAATMPWRAQSGG
jgi:O-antigen ligase